MAGTGGDVEVDPFELRKIARPLRTCWVLDGHWDHESRHRTPTGALLYEAKTYANKPGEPQAAEALAKQMGAGAAVLLERGRLRPPDLIVGVPSNPPKQPHNLPDVLAIGIAASLGIPYYPSLIRKISPTRDAKTAGHNEIMKYLEGAFEITGPVLGKTVLVVDDLVRTGGTLSTVGALLLDRGASPESSAFVATRAERGMRT